MYFLHSNACAYTPLCFDVQTLSTRELTLPVSLRPSHMVRSHGPLTLPFSNAAQVSRSLGDVKLKAFGVSAEPDTRVHFKITSRDQLLMLACDGLWSRLDVRVTWATFCL